MTMTAPVVEHTDPDLVDEHRLAHIVPKAELMEALINGTPVEALCGHVWVPSRDPKRYPLCEQCKEIHEGRGGSADRLT